MNFNRIKPQKLPMNSVFPTEKHHTMVQRSVDLSYECSLVVIRTVGGFSLLSVILCGSDGKLFGPQCFLPKRY